MANPEHAASSFAEIVVIRQPVARFVITYYWLAIFVSLIIFLFEAIHYENRIPLIIELSFYPWYLVVGFLTKRFLQQTVPNTFRRLRDTGALEDKVLEGELKRFVRRLNHPLAHTLCIIVGLFFLWYYKFNWDRRNEMELGRVLLDVGFAIIDALFAYALCVAIWRAGVTAGECRQFGRTRTLKVRPFHPDGCAGLAAIGQLLFSFSFILIVIGLFFSGWLLCGRLNYIPSGWTEGFAHLTPWLAGGLLGVVLASIMVFFLPLLTIHRMMKEEAVGYESRVLDLAGRIADLEDSLLLSASSPNYEELEARLAQIESLRSAYLHQQKIPTWPVDFKTRGKFLTAQLSLWIGMSLSILSFWEKAKSSLPFGSLSPK